MKFITFLSVFLVFVFTFVITNSVQAGKITNKNLGISLLVPDNMQKVKDTFKSVDGELYYDTTAGVVLMISGWESKFKSVKDYMDCSTEKLEQLLQANYGDTSLKLLSCNKSAYFPKKTTELNFEVTQLPFGYNTYTIFFLHHKSKDVQISFTYKKEKNKESHRYIDSIMTTLKLK